MKEMNSAGWNRTGKSGVRPWVVVVLLVQGLLAAGIYAQEEKKESSASSSLVDSIDNAVNQSLQDDVFKKKAPVALLPNGIGFDDLDEESKEAFLQSMHDYFSYHSVGYKHREKVFRWQLVSSYVIFFVVILLVLIGIFFSWIQFRKETDLGTTDLQIGKDGVKISSSVTGLVILVISLGFFYLYLVYVFPIKELF
jgi:hypothetical protein